jgi:sarcosine oxidase, subunit gamma
MVEAYQRRSALAHFGLAARAAQANPAAAGVILGESAHRTIINIRGNAGDLAFAASVRAASGVALPTQANTVTVGGDLKILWLGPDEWWVVGPEGRSVDLLAGLRQAFQGQHTAVTDVSESRTVITLTGPKARDLLARGVSLDLHPRVFAAGHCAQTSLSRANVLLHQTDDRPSYDIYVLKSFADYLWQWMGLVAEDFGLAVAG